MNESVNGGTAVELWLTNEQPALQGAVVEALAEAGVHVVATVREGVATLSGTVSSYAERLAARRAAMGVKHIWRVEDEMVVELDPGVAGVDPSDATLQAMARASLAWDSRLPGGLSASVENGRLTLDGMVNTDAEREAAFENVTRLRGVREVVNRITLRRAATLQHAVARLEDAIERHLGPAGKRVRVRLTEDGVALTGRVPSLADRAAAERAVRRVLGDVEVDDQVIVPH